MFVQRVFAKRLCAKRVFVILALSLLAGCGLQNLVDPARVFDERERAQFSKVSAALTARNADELIALSDPAIITPQAHDQLAAEFQVLPGGDLIGQELIGAFKVLRIGAAKEMTYTATYQYHFAEGWAVATIGLHRVGDDASDAKLYTLKTTRVPDDLKVINAFTLARKGPAHFTMLAVMGLVVGFTLFTLVSVIRMRAQLKRPVLWGIAVLVGVAALQLNWTVGAFRVAVLAAGLFGAAAMKAGTAAPWILTVYFPLGAVVFWIMKATGRLRKKPPPETPATRVQ